MPCTAYVVLLLLPNIFVNTYTNFIFVSFSLLFSDEMYLRNISSGLSKCSSTKTNNYSTDQKHPWGRVQCIPKRNIKKRTEREGEKEGGGEIKKVGYIIFPTINKIRQINITSLCPLQLDHQPKKGAAKNLAKLKLDETNPKNCIVPLSW